MVHASFATPLLLPAHRAYYLVASETQGGDSFYAAASKQPCAGMLGTGGTLPRMRVLTDALTVDGGVYGSAAESSGR